MSDTARSQYLFTRGLTTAKIVYPKYIRDLMLSNIMLAIRSFSREETWKEGKTRTKVILRSIGTKMGSYLSAVRPFSRCWRARPIVTTTLFQKLHRMRLSKTQLYLDTFVRTTASDMCQGFIKEHVTSGRFIFAADLWRLRSIYSRKHQKQQRQELGKDNKHSSATCEVVIGEQESQESHAAVF